MRGGEAQGYTLIEGVWHFYFGLFLEEIEAKEWRSFRKFQKNSNGTIKALFVNISKDGSGFK